MLLRLRLLRGGIEASLLRQLLLLLLLLVEL